MHLFKITKQMEKSQTESEVNLKSKRVSLCISSSVYQAAPHFDLGWRPPCQKVNYGGRGGEHVYQASSSTISIPRFLLDACCQ